jgi:hypothetical protein
VFVGISIALLVWLFIYYTGIGDLPMALAVSALIGVIVALLFISKGH